MTDGKDKEGLEGVRLTPPYVVDLSKGIKGRYGYKDAHVELEVSILPSPWNKILKAYRQDFTFEEAKLLYAALGKAIEFGNLPDYQRQRDGA